MKKNYFVIFATFWVHTGFATVYSGTYTGGITVSTPSTVASNTVFDGGYIDLKNDLTIEDNVQFLNHALATFNGASLYYAKINYINSPLNVNINGNDVLFQNNYFAAYLDGNTTLSINGDRTHFINNHSAISTTDISYYNKPSNYSGTNIIINGQDTLFDNNTFYTHNSYTTQGGGAVFIATGDFLIINGLGTIFSNNSSTNARGGAIYNYGNVQFNNPVIFNNNSAKWGGGAITNSYYYDMYNAYTSHNANLYIAPNSQFTNNSVTNGYGGAIYNSANEQYSAYTLIGHDTLFSGNTASETGGAIYNLGQKAVVDIDTGNTSVNFATASDSIYNNGGTINFLGTGNINASLTSLTSVQGSCVSCSPIINLGKTSSDFDTVNISDNTIIKTMVYSDGENVRVGNISANNFNIQNDDRIKLVVLVDNRKVVPMGGSEISIFIDKSGLQSDGWDYFGNDTKNPTFNLEDNRAYNIEFVRDGVYRITQKNFMEYDPSDESDVADNVSFVWGGGTGFESGSLAENISNQIYVLSQSESTKDQYNLALDSVLPNTSGIIESFVNHSANANMRRIQQRQIVNKTGFWGNADYSALNYTNNKNDYTGSGIGGIFGQDVSLTNNIFIGGAIGYNQANMKNDLREIDISQQFNMSLYSKYTVPFNRFWFYADAILNHGQYSIKETRNIFDNKAESEISANSVSFQLDAGIKRNWFGVDGGFRYNMLSFGNFTDSVGQHVSGVNLNLAYATTKAYIYDNVGILSFGAHAGANFLLSGDKNYQNIAVAPNMQRYYYTIELNPGTMFSFGCNADVAITDKLTVGLLYDGIIDGNYTEHTGKLHFNYKL